MCSGFPKGEFKLKTQNAKQLLMSLLGTITHSCLLNTVFCEPKISKFLHMKKTLLLCSHYGLKCLECKEFSKKISNKKVHFGIKNKFLILPNI